MQGIVEKKRSLLVHKIRWRTQTLLFSLILNAAFLAIFFYFFIRESPIPITFSYKPVIAAKEVYLTNNEVFTTLESLSSEKLFSLLKKDRHIEEGITLRDLSLTMLVAKDKFDIERCLGKTPELKGKLKIQEKSFPIYELSDHEYKTVCQFAFTERFPFTFEKLFQTLKEKNDLSDPLVQMFFMSEYFGSVEKLFSKLPLQKKTLLSMLLEGSYETLFNFHEGQKKQFDHSDKARRNLLLRYIQEGSQNAASLFLQTDMNFALRFFDDKIALVMLQRLNPNNEHGMKFATHLLNSSRGSTLKKAAEIYLSQDKDIAQKFYNRPSIGHLRPVYRDDPPAAPSPQQHIVMPGESLWAISKRYGILIEDLMKFNNLTTTNISPGLIIKLP